LEPCLGTSFLTFLVEIGFSYNNFLLAGTDFLYELCLLYDFAKKALPIRLDVRIYLTKISW